MKQVPYFLLLLCVGCQQGNATKPATAKAELETDAERRLNDLQQLPKFADAVFDVDQAVTLQWPNSEVASQYKHSEIVAVIGKRSTSAVFVRLIPARIGAYRKDTESWELVDVMLGWTYSPDGKMVASAVYYNSDDHELIGVFPDPAKDPAPDRPSPPYQETPHDDAERDEPGQGSLR